MPTRPCVFCLALQDGSVFADFDVDSTGSAFLVRISFDGYGCCHIEEGSGIGTISPDDTAEILAAIEGRTLQSPGIVRILENYFDHNRSLLWQDALEDHQLISDARSNNG